MPVATSTTDDEKSVSLTVLAWQVVEDWIPAFAGMTVWA